MNGPEPTLDAASVQVLTRLGRGFVALSAVAFVLIVFGALVRAHGAGLSCPDWPLCYGEWVPVFNFQIALEWGHRLLAGTLSIGLLGLGGLIALHPVARRVAGAGVGVAVLLVALQIVLGGLTVLHLLARWSVTSHLLVGNAFAAALALIGAALLSAASPKSPSFSTPPVMRAVALGASLFFGLQMILGGLVSSSYSGLACTEWPTCEQGVWIPTLAGGVGLQILHRFNGYAVFLAFSLLLVLTPSRHPAAVKVRLAWGLVVAQIGLGILNVLWKLPVEITALHSAVAALLFLTTTFLVRDLVWRGQGVRHSPSSAPVGHMVRA